MVRRRSPCPSAMRSAASMMRSRDSGIGGRFAGMAISLPPSAYFVKAAAPVRAARHPLGRARMARALAGRRTLPTEQPRRTARRQGEEGLRMAFFRPRVSREAEVRYHADQEVGKGYGELLEKVARAEREFLRAQAERRPLPELHAA